MVDCQTAVFVDFVSMVLWMVRPSMLPYAAKNHSTIWSSPSHVPWYEFSIVLTTHQVSFIDSFIHSFLPCFLHSFIHSPFHPFIYSSIHSIIHSFIHSFDHSFIHAFIHSSVHSIIHLFMHWFIHSCIHSFDHSFIHAFIHSFILAPYHFSMNYECMFSYLHKKSVQQEALLQHDHMTRIHWLPSWRAKLPNLEVQFQWTISG
jgi:hypothetical protein